MAVKQLGKEERRYRLLVRAGYTLVLILLALVSAGFVFVLETKNIAFEQSSSTSVPLANSTNREKVELPEPFPLGVDPASQSITENPAVENFVELQLTSNHTTPDGVQGFFQGVLAELSKFEWYQNLASPSTRTLVVRSGERVEEVSENFGHILGWNRNERNTFRELVASSTPKMDEGKLYAGTYVVPKGTDPEFIATLVIDRFDSEIRSRYTPDIEKKVP